MTPRYYQDEMVSATLEFLCTKQGNPLVVAPTGTGKSLVLNMLAKEVATRWGGKMRVMIVTHTQEIVGQNAASMLRYWPEAPVGVYSAALKQRDTTQQILFTSIQSIAKRVADFGVISLLIIDEAHMVSPKSGTYYDKLVKGLKIASPDMKIVGFSATPYRLGQGMLTDTGLFTDICVDMTTTERFNQFVTEGHLSMLVTKATSSKIDVTDVSIRGGDFDEKQIQDLFDTSEMNRSVVREVVRHGATRKHWLGFASGVTHAENLAREFISCGINAGVVTGAMPTEERKNQIAKFKSGELRALINVATMTTGVDFPALDLIFVARATQSTGLWVQLLGRGTRTAPGKVNCIARGQRILTDQGLVPIQDVTIEMKLWDGVDFVRHGGTVCNGTHPIMTYEKITATPDHRVKTVYGWRTLGECLEKNIPLRVTGIDGTPVREVEDHFTCSVQTDLQRKASNLCKSALSTVWSGRLKIKVKSNRRSRRMSDLCAEGCCKKYLSSVAMETVLHGKKTMSGSNRQHVLRLWCQRCKISIRFTKRDGYLGDRESRSSPPQGVRPQRQQRTLRAGEHSLFHQVPKFVSHPQEKLGASSGFISRAASGTSIHQNHFEKLFIQRHYRIRNTTQARKVQDIQTSEVWDIINSGPRNSFTCEGRLVHNCLVLDHGQNTSRLGPINSPVIPKPRKKGDNASGDAPVKVCPDCSSYVHTKVAICPDCGYEFPPASCIEASASTMQVMVDSAEEPVYEEFQVLRTVYQAHTSKAGTPCVKVTYQIGASFASEYLPLTGEGYAVQKVDRWWRIHGGKKPSPLNQTDFLARTGELKSPVAITVVTNKRFLDVTSTRFE